MYHVLDGADVAALVAVDGLDGHHSMRNCLRVQVTIISTSNSKPCSGFQDGFHQAAADEPVAALVVTDGLPQ